MGLCLWKYWTPGTPFCSDKQLVKMALELSNTALVKMRFLYGMKLANFLEMKICIDLIRLFRDFFFFFGRKSSNA